MTTEFNDPLPQRPNVAEHSRDAGAKKVIPGPLFAVKHATEERTIEPLQIAAPGAIALAKDKAYRIVSDGGFFYKLSSVSPAPASTNDIYIPGDTPTVIASRGYNVMTVTAMSGSFVQALEIH